MGVARIEVDESSPTSLLPYVEAFKLKRKMQDEVAWVNGVYLQSAFSTSLDHAFNGSKAKSRYIEKPLLSESTMTEEEREEAEIQKLIAEEYARIENEKRLFGTTD